MLFEYYHTRPRSAVKLGYDPTESLILGDRFAEEVNIDLFPWRTYHIVPLLVRESYEAEYSS